MRNLVFAIVGIAIFLPTESPAAVTKKSVIKWSVTIQENGIDKEYQGKELLAVIEKTLELKQIGAKCSFEKSSSMKPIANEKLGVVCVLGNESYVVRTDVICAQRPGFFGSAPLFLGKPDPAKLGKPKEASAMIGITCMSQ